MTGGKGGKGGGAVGDPNIYTQAANAYNAATMAAGGAGATYGGLAGYTAPSAGPAATVNVPGLGGPTAAADPTKIYEGIAGYMNPYEDAVVGTVTSDIDRARKMQLEQVAGEAASSGAFGGSRHGLVEAETNRAATDSIASTSAGLRKSGWDTAAGLSAADIANALGVDRFNAASANEFALADFTGKLGAAGQDASAKNTMALADQAADLAGAGVRADAAGGLTGLTDVLRGLSESGVNIGQLISGVQQQQGGMQQGLMQMLIDGALGMFGGQSGQGDRALALLNETLGLSPMNNASKTTQTHNPGLFDYLSLAAGTASTLYNPFKKPGAA